MTTLHRILKYTPAVVLGLLVVAWVLSWGSEVRVELGPSGKFFLARSGAGCLGINYPTALARAESVSCRLTVFNAAKIPGILQISDYAIVLPYPLLIGLSFPLAFGPFLSFRFRLWHYLAYTTLVAAELAYYLRWQE